MATHPTLAHFPLPQPQALPAQGRPLARKLAQVLAEVHRVPKNGRNDFHRYDYVYESDLVDHIRDKLAEQGVAIFPSVADHSVTSTEDGKGRTSYLTTVTLDVTLIDGESGDLITTTWVGQGLDSGDKGYYKAYTGALKYFLLKTFLISTGDDPEEEEESASPPAAKPTGRLSEEERWGERRAELSALLEECIEEQARTAFERLYVKRMGAKSLDEIDSSKIGAMCRKLRGLNREARRHFVEGVIGEHQ